MTPPRFELKQYNWRQQRFLRTGGLYTVDSDLALMSRDQLVEEVQRLRDGIRRHRDSSGHDLCWHHPDLWGLLPESTDPLPLVPEWPEFLQGCIRYRQSLDEQAQTRRAR